MKVYLDDVRPLPDDSWTPALTYQEAVAILEANVGNIEEMSFDHDLGPDSFQIHYDDKLNEVKVERTGYDVLLYIVQMKYDGKATPKKYKVHSANPVGCERMQGVIDRYLCD